MCENINVFRCVADTIHLFAKYFVIGLILQSESCNDLSQKTQLFYLIVFLSRYADLFFKYISLYNTMFKLIYIILSVYLLYFRFDRTCINESHFDDFTCTLVIFTLFICALIVNHKFTVLEILWAFSIYLESVAIVPQLLVIKSLRKVDNAIFYYLLILGLYRFLYLFNWVWRYIYVKYYDWIAMLTGVIQTVLFSIFLSVYFFICHYCHIMYKLYYCQEYLA